MSQRITAAAFAARRNISVGQLANERSAGRSPVGWYKLGGRVVYDLAEVEAWEATRYVAAGVG